jgi:Zn-finger nucleic acid-binding protein
METTMGGVTVDGCDGCGGVWFDNKELTAVAQAQAAQLKELEDIFQPNPFVLKPKAKMTCPACQVELVEFEFKHSPGIKLDGCPQCKGIWVDDGELKAINDRLTGTQTSAAPPSVQQPDTRHKARQAMGFLTNVECPACKQSNPTASLVCWACGAVLKGKRGFLCPRCDAPLKGDVYYGLRLDVCQTCDGIWFDADEFSNLMQRDIENIRPLQKLVGAGKVNMDAVLETRNVLMCPACYLPMEGQQFGGSSGVRIERCPQCKGVWVDAGELVLIAQFLAKEKD